MLPGKRQRLPQKAPARKQSGLKCRSSNGKKPPASAFTAKLTTSATLSKTKLTASSHRIQGRNWRLPATSCMDETDSFRIPVNTTRGAASFCPIQLSPQTFRTTRLQAHGAIASRGARSHVDGQTGFTCLNPSISSKRSPAFSPSCTVPLYKPVSHQRSSGWSLPRQGI